MTERRPFVGGNWKMNTALGTGSDLARGVADAVAGIDGVEVAVFPPFCYLAAVGAILRGRQSRVRLAAQDVSQYDDGAYTGEISAAMLVDCGVEVVLVGHSERRHVLGEDDQMINAKLRKAVSNGLEVVLCVGETESQRDAGQTDAINQHQIRRGLVDVSPEEMAKLTIAYEPVWAIGTGRTATPADAQDAHAKIRGVLADLFSPAVAEATRIQYGGSVKPSNAADLFAQPDIDGGLIGGASLQTSDFAQIVRAAGE